MSGRAPGSPRAVLGAAGLPAMGVLLALCCAGGCRGPGAPREEVAEDEQPAAPQELEVELYFPGPGGLLHPERRMLAAGDGVEARVRLVVEALLAGPRGEDLAPSFAAEMELADLHLSADGVAFVDLLPPEGTGLPAAGSTEERQIVFSLVNSVCLNLPEVRRVVLLWNGTQPASLAGHLDTSRPLGPDPDLIARR